MIPANALKFYINGAWVDPVEPRTIDVINPATETAIGQVSLGSSKDVDAAVAAARAAFPAYAKTTREERMALLEKIIASYKKRMGDLGAAISAEMGAPLGFATKIQGGAGLSHFMTALAVLKDFPFEEKLGTTEIIREPIGVAGMITPWNWPANQITCKVAPALAAGCTMVLKPSELAPYSAIILAEILAEAGVPKGVFNLINGDGPGVGSAMSAHPGIDLMSFTGSTRAGIEVAIRSAPTVKRVSQELGGKSPNILLDDCDFPKMVTASVQSVMRNSGQSCNAPTRLLVPAARMKEVAALATTAANALKVGDPKTEGVDLGPVVSAAQWQKIQGYIAKGIEGGATLSAGGPGRPDGLTKGYYVKPTVFTDVHNSMTIAQEEIFGPVLVVIPYKDEAEAIKIANDTPFGLAAYVNSGDRAHAIRVAKEIKAGMVHINMAFGDTKAPFGGMKQSGNGREWGRFGFDEYLEVKAVMGYNAP